MIFIQTKRLYFASLEDSFLAFLRVKFNYFDSEPSLNDDDDDLDFIPKQWFELLWTNSYKLYFKGYLKHAFFIIKKKSIFSIDLLVKRS